RSSSSRRRFENSSSIRHPSPFRDFGEILSRAKPPAGQAGYDAAMPVSDHLAFPLLRAFGQLEYELKQRSGLLRADRYGNAMVDWGAVKAAIAALPAGSFQARLSERTLDKMLGGARNRPRVQIVEEVHGRPAPHFVVQDLDRDDARALVELPNGCGTI